MKIFSAWLKQLGKPAHLLDSSSWNDPPADLAKCFLPGGVFTTMRLNNVDGNMAPVSLSVHMERLEKNGIGIEKTVIEKEVSEFIRTNLIGKYNEYRWVGLTVMLSPSTFLNSIGNLNPVPTFGYCLKTIEEVPKSCTVVTCRTAGRSDPTVKSTNWIEERKALKELIKGTSHNEVLIVDGASRAVLEGLSSNFGVLTKDGRLVTAPDSLVLPGSVMKLVKQVCLDLNVHIKDACPSINDAAEWQAAFITSTSRLVLPITRIFLDNTEDSIEIDSLSSSLLRRIQYHVNQSISIREETKVHSNIFRI